MEKVYIASSNEKKTLLDEFNKRLESALDCRIIASGSQGSSVVKALYDCLEESNMLVVTVSLQILQRLMSMMRPAFSEILTRHIISRAAGKYQSSISKTLANDLVLSLISAAVSNEIITMPALIDCLLEIIQSSKKTNSRECCLIWLTKDG